MKWFRKTKEKKHNMVQVAAFPIYHRSMRAIKCTECKKQFVMEALGGWIVEWEYVLDDIMHINIKNFDSAVDHFYNHSRTYGWTRTAHDDICRKI